MGKYPQPGDNDETPVPRARYFPNWWQVSNRVHLFGGAYGCGAFLFCASSPDARRSSGSITNWVYLNDLFVFDVSIRQWTVRARAHTQNTTR